MSNSKPVPAEIQDIIDSLCNEGCQAVTHYIADIEAQDFPLSMQVLSDIEKQIVLAELKNIMAVYDSKGD